MHFIEMAGRWLAALDLAAAAPGLVERLEAVVRPGTEQRTIAAPYYLTDLGVRRSADPRVFLSAHLDVLQGQRISDPAADRRYLLDAPLDALGDLLDVFVLITGDYDTARKATLHRLPAILADGEPRLLVHTGVLLAALGHPEARPALERAADTARTPVVRFMALHRLAAAEIKRFGRPDEGIVLLDEIDDEIDTAVLTGAISAGDRRTLLSVTANLRALGLIRLGRGREARDEITRSLGLHTLAGLSEVGADEATRYGAQERINLAQVLGHGGDLDGAVAQLTDNVARCRDSSPDYLGEALSALAYAQLRASDWSAAMRSATEAAERIAFEASPTRLRTAREIRIAAHARAGQDEAALRVLRASEDDPLGLTISHPGGAPGTSA